MMMRNFITCVFATIVMLIFLRHHPVVSLSPIQQKTALFQFQQSLTISEFDACYVFGNIPSYPKTMNWSMNSDYCTWEGVSCERKTRDVIGLDLSCSLLEGAILPNSTLFQLSRLRFLNLSWNDFSLSNQFPQEFGFFAKGLTHLNLSGARFSGRVPSGISHLYKLVSLDLSYNDGSILEKEVFKSVLQNLTQLRVLNLEFLNISSSLPVNLSTSLRVLNLGFTGLHGVLSQEVFQLPNLELLDLSHNYNLTVILPKVKWGSSGTLQDLNLPNVDIYGGIPDSIGFLESLASLELPSCNLSGPIPKSIGNLGQLTYLGLDGNNLNGPILTFLANLTNLTNLDLSHNNFTGLLPSSFLAHSSQLVVIDLRYNGFTGPLPPGLFDHPSLRDLDISHNGFTGQLYEFDSSKSKLQYFYCKNNSLYGPIPQSFSQLVNLTHLDFSLNNFSGVLDFKMFSRLESLQHLDLSHNSLSVRNTSMVTLSRELSTLRLSSCNMKEFPRFSTGISLEFLDLSNNEIDGEIPHWIGSVNSYVDLSQNMLSGGLEQLPWNSIHYLDLHSNMLSGSLPTLLCNSISLRILNLSNNTLSGLLPICRTFLTNLLVFDLRRNNFQGNIPATLSNSPYLRTINLNGNKLEGTIPSSFAEFDHLEVLDLGNNQINDTFPWFLEALPNLQVLVLKSNKFHGLINTISKVEHPFPRLRIIDLSINEFYGPLPAIYFKNFKGMMNGNVNKIERSYLGEQFGADSSYRDSTILVIKGVEIEFHRILTVLTTIDVSSNNFEGEILEYIGDLVSLRYLNLSYNHLTGHIPSSIGDLSMLESLDLSSNQLEGEIPQELTGIYTLERLNLSHNQLSGRIPEGSQFNTFENDSYVGNLGLCGHSLSRKCEIDILMQTQDEDGDNNDFFDGFTWEAVVIGYGCGVVPAFFIGYLMLLAGKPKWFAGIIARELGLKIRRMEIKWR
ncbi:Serine/threonine-protein kinase bri1 [Heracleum sosnowskyi]|uniref:Serine/threonine-protein kinase bri1 n=1 Tax=Heracleum sosnowskyi TaxID=360622 RepID=A0AAD8GRK2_9APIA|nr:Serine/threonine-protein kinase bri1 [Heracleum sosnowskyi]